MPNFIETLPQDMRSAIPEDLSREPSLATIPDVPTLVKNYVNAQKLVGVDKVPLPQKNWTEQQFNEFYTKLGRPESADKYGIPEDAKLADGIKLDDKMITDAKAHFHKLGLSQEQGNKILGFYVNLINGTQSATQEASRASLSQAEEALKTEWKDKYDYNLDLAKAAVKKFGDPELSEFLETSGLGNNPRLVKLMANIGKAMMEDSSAGKGMGQLMTTQSQALREIDTMKTDGDFMKALMQNEHPGHRAAVERWTGMFSVAFPQNQHEDQQ